jgi:hypothetical protein
MLQNSVWNDVVQLFLYVCIYRHNKLFKKQTETVSNYSALMLTSTVPVHLSTVALCGVIWKRISCRGIDLRVCRWRALVQMGSVWHLADNARTKRAAVINSVKFIGNIIISLLNFAVTCRDRVYISFCLSL